MQNFQVIVLSVWEPTDKTSHLHDCTFNEEINWLKQPFQEQTLPKVNQQPVSQQQPQNLFPFSLSPS